MRGKVRSYEVFAALAGFAGGVGRAPTSGVAGATGAVPNAVTAASRFAVAAATATTLS